MVKRTIFIIYIIYIPLFLFISTTSSLKLFITAKNLSVISRTTKNCSKIVQKMYYLYNLKETRTQWHVHPRTNVTCTIDLIWLKHTWFEIIESKLASSVLGLAGWYTHMHMQMHMQMHMHLHKFEFWSRESLILEP